MSGIYIHIPFCKQACSYCDFHFSTNLKLQEKVVAAMCKELESRKNEIVNPVKSIYFGGGSPSILKRENLERITGSLARLFDLSDLEEFTLESNPDDHSDENLAFWRSLGINRLSVGIQSFVDRDLVLMHRAHDANQALGCVQNARKAGFDTFSLDLIYGVPNQTMEEWKQNILQAVQLNPQHISAYCLTIEERTALHHKIQTGVLEEKMDEQIAAEYQALCTILSEAGYVHYEVSNFALSGHEAKHNGSYWSGVEYVGIGPSAHSFDGRKTRRWNVANNAEYIRLIASGGTYFESENLSVKERFNEQIMTGLRTVQGLDLSEWPASERSEVLRNAASLMHSNSISVHENRISIPESNWLVSDHIIRALLLD